MSSTPLVSIILCVRNGMPHVRDAVESVRAQTYGNYELVIQDAASTDGTTEYLRSLKGFANMSFASAPDSGMGQGFNRALARCRGDLVATVDADNRLKPHALGTAVHAFQTRPDAAVIYGTCDVINEQGQFVHTFIPRKFDLLGLLDGSVVPPFGSSVFSRRVCGDRLYFDEDFVVVPDFALWLRLASLPIVRILDVLIDVRAGRQSNTYQPDSYDKHTHFKLRAANAFLSDERRELALEALRRRAEAGIHLWAADSMQVIGGPQERIDRFFEKAVGGNLMDERFRSVVARVKPTLRHLDQELEQDLLACGRELQGMTRHEDALVYFELLKRSGSSVPELDELIERSRSGAKDVHLMHVMADNTLQAEIDRRDEMLRELQRTMQTEVAIRDQLLSDLRRHVSGEVRRRDRQLSDLRHQISDGPPPASPRLASWFSRWLDIFRRAQEKHR